MQRVRELADYDMAAVFTGAEATAAVEDATSFATEVDAYLAGEGWIAER